MVIIIINILIIIIKILYLYYYILYYYYYLLLLLLIIIKQRLQHLTAKVAGLASETRIRCSDKNHLETYVRQKNFKLRR